MGVFFSNVARIYSEREATAPNRSNIKTQFSSLFYQVENTLKNTFNVSSFIYLFHLKEFQRVQSQTSDQNFYFKQYCSFIYPVLSHCVSVCAPFLSIFERGQSKLLHKIIDVLFFQGKKFPRMFIES